MLYMEDEQMFTVDTLLNLLGEAAWVKQLG